MKAKDKSFALYATLTKPVGIENDYQPFVISRDGTTHTIWVRAELHDCHYEDAMLKVRGRDGENFLNTQPAQPEPSP